MDLRRMALRMMDRGWTCGRPISAVVLLVLCAGCGGPSTDDRPAASAREWPLSALDLHGESLERSPGTQELGPLDLAASDEATLALADASGEVAGAAVTEPEPEPVVDAKPREIVHFPDARFPRPDHVRGLYLNAWAAGSTNRVSALIDLAKRTEVNAFVIDIKDATGYLSHESSVPLAQEIGANGERRIRDLPALLDRLEEAGIYPIARIVVVKDPLLSAHRPELAVQDTAGGVWIDSKKIIWMNPYSEGLWDYNVQIAREVAEMGFPEIQWDYIRFPDAPASDMARAVFTGSEGKERSQAIRGFLSYARESLSDLPVRSTADVFGVTTTFRRDIGIGQLWESFIDVVDVALPMIYPSHYWEGSFGYRHPNAYPYEVVRAALTDALKRSSAVHDHGLTRPWLQDFTLGEPAYGGAEVRAQIQATYDVGIQEWVLWNPSSRYSESALEPIGGFDEEPIMRVAGVLAPVSRRRAVIDSVAALPAPSELGTPRNGNESGTDIELEEVSPVSESILGGSGGAVPTVDSAGVVVAVRDSIGGARR